MATIDRGSVNGYVLLKMRRGDSVKLGLGGGKEERKREKGTQNLL